MKPERIANQPEQNLSSESRGHTYRRWAGSRDEILSASGRGGAFFLTSLFIELMTQYEAALGSRV
jgi:hypothetical protein